MHQGASFRRIRVASAVSWNHRLWHACLRRGLVFLLTLIFCFPFPGTLPVEQSAVSTAEAAWGQMPVVFLANQGQLDDQVFFYIRGRDKSIYFTSQGVTYALSSPAPVVSSPDIHGAEAEELSRDRNETIRRWVVRLDFVGAREVQPIGQERAETVVSYFKGSPDHWHTAIPTYSSILYPNLWPGIDLEYSGSVNRLKYRFIIRPGADPSSIRLAYQGADVRLTEAGRLEISTSAGRFYDDAPIAYQEVDGQRIPVQAAYALGEASAEGVFTYGFQVEGYDPSLPLILDPVVLIYCGFIGGADLDEARAVAVDVAGNVYITGETSSAEDSFPVTVGPDLTYNGGDDDIFVVKVRADGAALIYAGFIGGDDSEDGFGIAVDTAGNAYITGVTRSSEATFPVLGGPDLTYNGQNDAFVVKVNSAGTDLVYAGYVGGSGREFGNGIAVDSFGNAYIAGQTSSTEASFPVTVGPDLTFNYGETDAYVAKVNAAGTGLVYAGYIGGSQPDYGMGIAIDGSGQAYVVGYTRSMDFPAIVGPDLTYNGGTYAGDGFVAKVRTDGTGLVYAGFIGGANDDYASGVAVDVAENVYIAGYTMSTQASFPVIVGPDLTYNGGTYAGDAFVAKVWSSGAGLAYCGYIGGSGNDFIFSGLAIDALGHAYVAGSTDSDENTFPVLKGTDLTYNGYSDAFVAKVKPNGAGLIYAGYIGGSNSDGAFAIAASADGEAFVVGATDSSEWTFPVIVGPDLTYGGNRDGFVAKVSFSTTTVTTFDDESDGSCTDGDCSLRDAILLAVPGEIVEIGASGVISLTMGESLDIDTDLIISAPDGEIVTINGLGATRIFNISQGNVTLSGLTITNGHASTGGGIYNAGNLTLIDCAIADNRADSQGGGIYNASDASLEVRNSLIIGNQAAYGGGLKNDHATARLINSTFYNNTASIRGGGVDSDADSTLTVTNSTFVENNFGNPNSQTTIKNTIIADSTGADCVGMAFLAASSHNLATDGSCSPGFSQVAPADLGLDWQENYFALQRGIVAIDTGYNAACPSTDQRGVPRPQDGNVDGNAICDVGSYEYEPFRFRLPLLMR